MKQILKLTGLNGNRIFIDSRYVFAVAEMEADNEVPAHVAVFTDKVNFRVADHIECIIEDIEELNKNELLGL